MAHADLDDLPDWYRAYFGWRRVRTESLETQSDAEQMAMDAFQYAWKLALTRHVDCVTL